MALLLTLRDDRLWAGISSPAALHNPRPVLPCRRDAGGLAAGRAKIRTSNEEFYRFFHQAIDDMAALRLPHAGIDNKMSVPAAGLPWFLALFGRDSLIVSLQTMLVYPEFARGTLEVLGNLQARERDDYRDAEPGKILHEMRHGELAHFSSSHTPPITALQTRHCCT